MTVTDPRHLDNGSQLKSTRAIRITDNRINDIEVEGKFEGIPTVVLTHLKDCLIPAEAPTKSSIVVLVDDSLIVIPKYSELGLSIKSIVDSSIGTDIVVKVGVYPVSIDTARHFVRNQPRNTRLHKSEKMRVRQEQNSQFSHSTAFNLEVIAVKWGMRDQIEGVPPQPCLVVIRVREYHCSATIYLRTL